MKQKHRTGISILFLALLALIISSPVRAAEEPKRYDVWAWTKKNLNPTWMEWGEKYWPTEPVQGGYFRRASVNYVGLLNPNRWPVLDWGVINLFYEGIAAYDGQYRQTSPRLMESWQFHDARTLIMKLKSGIQFHDGTDFNANSLKYLFDWISDPANGCWTRAQHRIFESLEVVDEYTLRWRTHEAWGNFPAGFFSFQISQKALEGDVLIREAQRAAGKAARLRKIARTSGKKDDKEAAAKAEEEERVLADKIRGLKSTDLYPVGTGPYLFEEAEPGIDWTAEALDAVAMTDRWRNLEFDLALSVWPHIQDPFVLSRLYHPEGSWNFGRVHDEKVVQLLNAGQRETDQEKRQKKYQEIEAIIYNNYEDIWLWWEISAVAFRKNVQG